MDERKKKKLTLAQRAKRTEVQCRYIKKSYRRFEVRVHKEHEKEMYEFVESKENVQAYIKELIKKDMENNQ